MSYLIWLVIFTLVNVNIVVGIAMTQSFLVPLYLVVVLLTACVLFIQFLIK